MHALHGLYIAAAIAWTVASLVYVCVKRLPGDQCGAEWRGVECERELGHPGFHAAGSELSGDGASYWGRP